MKEIKIAILDDHPGIRLGITTLLESEKDFKICGNFGKGTELFDSLKSEIPDIIILDINLNGENGIEIMKTILSIYQQIKILVYSMLDEEVYAERILKNGGLGYIMKNEILEKIIKAIRTIISGNIYLSEKISSKIIRNNLKNDNQKDRFDTLSSREYEIFKMIGEGASGNEISQMFNISISTINTYKKRIIEKLNLENSMELKKIAIKHFNKF